MRILDRDGALLTEHGGAEAYASIDTLPQHLLDAVVATEDRRFYEHWGVDPVGLARAALANLRVGRFVQGGSTLTQQLAKNLFLTPERTLGRKLEELVLALWLEVRLSKRDILEIYLNRVYLGSGAYGVETASRRFFGKPASQLTLPESAMLAGLLKAPSKFSPASNPDRCARACAGRAGQDGRSRHAHGRGGGAGRQRSDRLCRHACTSARIRVSSMPSTPCSSACRGWLAPRLAS